MTGLIGNLPYELALRIVRLYLGDKERGRLAQVSRAHRALSEDTLIYRDRLLPEYRTIPLNDVIALYKNEREKRLILYRTLGQEGWERAFTVLEQVLSGTSNDSVSRIMRGQITEEERRILAEIEQELRRRNFPDGKEPLRLHTIKAFVASGILSLPDAKNLSWDSGLHIDNSVLRGMLIAGIVCFKQISDLKGTQSSNFNNENIHALMKSRVLSFDQIKDLNMIQFFNITDWGHLVIEKKRTIQDIIDLTAEQKAALESEFPKPPPSPPGELRATSPAPPSSNYLYGPNPS